VFRPPVLYRAVITSPSNPRVVVAASLHRSRQRSALGRTLLEGPKLVGDAVRSGALIDVVFAADPDDESVRLASRSGIEIVEVSLRVLDRLAGTKTPRGPIAVLRVPDPQPAAAVDAVVLAGVADPGNAGTLIRSAAAFGFAVHVGRDSADAWSPKVLRSAAGGHFATEVSRREAPVAEVGATGCVIAALVPSGGVLPSALDPDRPVGLVVGSEAHGLPADIVADADMRISLPMPGDVESLNAAVAGSIVMYERFRNRA
jgi:TrmH family RNA methyltransferase